MKALLILQLCGLAVLSLLTSACTLLPLTPSLSLSVQPEYTTSTITIPYSFQTLSHNSDGSARCSYSLSKFDSSVGGYLQIGGAYNSDTTLQAQGTLSFSLPTLLNTTAGSSTVDGLYKLTFSVLSDNYDQSGKPIPFSFLTQTKDFTVHSIAGPGVYEASPPIVNPSYVETVTFTGTGFTTGGALTTSPSISTGYTYVDPQHISASLNAGSVTAGGTVAVTFTDSQGAVSPAYYIPVVGQVTVTGASPTSDSNQDTALILTIAGTYLGFWSDVTITDAGGHTVTMQNQQILTASGTTYLRGQVDLTPLTTIGAATITVTNPDGSTPATTTFTVTN